MVLWNNVFLCSIFAVFAVFIQLAGSKLVQKNGFPFRKRHPHAKQRLTAGTNATLTSELPVKLICDVTKYPNANLSWLVDGRDVHTMFDITKGTFKVKTNILVLRNAVSAAYTCVVEHESATVQRTSFIKYVDPEAPQIHPSMEEVTIVDNTTEQAITVGANATIYIHSRIILVCNVTGFPAPYIRWKKNGELITQYTLQNKLVLSYDPKNSGQYMCKAKNYLGAAKRSSFIKFLEPVKPAINLSKKRLYAINGENDVYLKIGDQVTTIAGTAVDIQCLASGIPKPRITWCHNGKVSENTLLVNLNEENYFYNQAIPGNASGNYTCTAKNAFGVAQATSHIKVIKPVFPFINSSDQDAVYYDMTVPFIKTIGGTLETLVGASISLYCPAGGIPRPEVTWHKDISPIKARKRVRISGNRMDLLGTIMSDTGWYTCKAYNGGGSVTKSTFVQLLAPERPRIKRRVHRYSYIVDNLPTPYSTSVGIDLRILAHREVTLLCSATGFPTPVLTWRRNGRAITKEDDVYVSLSGNKLVFKHLRLAQRGRYTCVASNAAGQDIAQTLITTRLPRKPKIEITTVVLTSYKGRSKGNMESRQMVPAPPAAPTQPLLAKGTDIVLECYAKTGYPKSHFTWFKDGKALHMKTKETFNRSKLKLRNLQTSDQGTYKCFANNNIGEHETTTVVQFVEDHSNHSNEH